MELKDRYMQPPILGLPESPRELWDIGDGYEIYVSIEEKTCSFGIQQKNIKDITFEVAQYLGVDTSQEALLSRGKGKELFISPSIDCVTLNYTHPEKYKDLLLRIEEIVNKYFKKST